MFCVLNAWTEIDVALTGLTLDPVGAGLPAMAAYQATSFLMVYISITGVTAAIGSALTAGHLEERQVTKRSRP